MEKFTKEMVDPQAFVLGWFERQGYSARDALNIPHLFSMLYLHYESIPKQGDGLKYKVFSEKLLKHAYDVYIETNLASGLPRAIQDLLCAQENTQHVEAWISAVTGSKDTKSAAVIKHWLWLIKRKALALPVKYQIMPVLNGEQQGGKSTAIRKLVQPLTKYLLTLRLDKLSDERNYHSFAHNLIVFVDEMQGAERADLNSLKNQITTETNSFRKLYTHATVNVPMACSFIGATNKHLNEMLSDSTGMRRFYEIKTVARLDWKTINSIDYAALWAGINENLADGYLTGDILAEVNSKQRELVLEDDIDLFIRECKVRPVVGTKLLTASCLYRGYRDWAIEAGQRYPWGRASFVNKLKNRNFTYEKIKDVLHFHVSQECMVKKLELIHES